MRDEMAQNFESDLVEIKSFLVSLKYPDVVVLTDTQISDMFNKENILRFLEWVLNKLTIKIPADKSKVAFVADVFWKKGIFDHKEKENFLKNASLDVFFFVFVNVRSRFHNYFF